jgi:chromosome partitioning protein
MRKALEKLDGYDYVLIDCPPSLGILTLNALIAAHSVLVVVQSSFLSAKGLQTILDVVKDIRDDLNPRLQVEGFLLTQANNTVIRRDIAEWVRDNYQGKVFQTVIRQNVALEEATARGQDIFQYNPHANGAEDYRNLAKELMG